MASASNARRGLVLEGRKGQVSEDKREFIKPRSFAPPALDVSDLTAVIRTLRPTTLIGAASVSGKLAMHLERNILITCYASLVTITCQWRLPPSLRAALVDAPTLLMQVGGAFSPAVLRELTDGLMSLHGPRSRPVVLALSNPTSKAECSYAEALAGTGMAAVFGSGTQFPAFEISGDDASAPSRSVVARTLRPAQVI